VTERLATQLDDTMPLAPPGPRSTGVARVNLLPPEIERERRRQRVAAVSVGLLVTYLCVLAIVYVLELGDVAEAQRERDRVAAEITTLEAEIETLDEYRTLTATIAAREALLTAAMEDETSWARVFGELALSFSDDASLNEVQAATAEAQEGAAATAAATDGAEPGGAPVGQISFSGYSVERVAPGVEEVLVEMGEGAGFVDSYVVTTTDEKRGEEQVTAFEGRVDLNRQVHTHRYDDGLPQESIE
jgi:cell division protein FtsB